MIRVGYFLPAGEDVIAEIRRALDPDWELVTDPSARDLDFVITARMNREAIRSAPGLRLIQLPGVGSDKVDLAAAAERGIPVCEGAAGSNEEVAEFTILLMLAVSRRLVEIANRTRAGDWTPWGWRTRSHSLHGKQLGIVGMGRIGREVARRAEAFGMHVAAGPIDRLLESSDYLSLHCPLKPETRHLLNRERIARMKAGAILINTARGELVDEAALIEALRSGHLAGAGLDVLEREPPEPGNPLLAMDQVICTPHLATGTIDSLRAKAAFYAENIRRVLRGAEPMGSVVRFTKEQYFALERQAETKSEFHDGQIFAMSGGSPNHARLGGRMHILLDTRLPEGCEAFNSELRIGIEDLDKYTYADCSVVCGTPRYLDGETLANPLVIVEVLSPSTEAYDRGKKFQACQLIESLREYILVSQDCRRVEHFSKQGDGTWNLRTSSGNDGRLVIERLGVTITLAELYAKTQGIG